MVWCYKAMRKRTKQLSTLLTREDWELLGSFGSGVQTYATTGGASYDDTGKWLTEFCGQYCDTHELCSKAPCVMRMRGPNNVEMLTDPTLWHYAMEIMKQKNVGSCWLHTLHNNSQPHFNLTQQFAAQTNTKCNTKQSWVCWPTMLRLFAWVNAIFDLLHSSYHTQPCLTQ